MTKFNKDQFHYHGGYLEYWTNVDANGVCAWEDRKFIARFKYVGGNKAGFQSFLIKNFTVEEYFAELDAGKTPLDILESKGYIQSHVKKWMKQAGYTTFTAETKEHWFQNVYRKQFDKKVA